MFPCSIGHFIRAYLSVANKNISRTLFCFALLKEWSILQKNLGAMVPKGVNSKAELLLEGTFFALNFLPWEFLLIKKLEIKKTKSTEYNNF